MTEQNKSPPKTVRITRSASGVIEVLDHRGEPIPRVRKATITLEYGTATVALEFLSPELDVTVVDREPTCLEEIRR